MIPWRDVSIVGTSHDSHDDTADQLKVSRRDLEAFLKDAREAFPHANLTTADVQLIHRGLLPMIAGEGSQVQLLKESQVVDHSKHGLHGPRFDVRRPLHHRATDGAGSGRRGVPRARPRDPSALPHGGNAATGRQHQPDGHFPAGRSPSGTSTAFRPRPSSGSRRRTAPATTRVLQVARDIPALGDAPRPRLRCDRRRNPPCGAHGNGPKTRRCAAAPHGGRRRRPPWRRCRRARRSDHGRAPTGGMSGARGTRSARSKRSFGSRGIEREPMPTGYRLRATARERS